MPAAVANTVNRGRAPNNRTISVRDLEDVSSRRRRINAQMDTSTSLAVDQGACRT